nr:tripeptidyl-peptidase sed1 [Quercus suber]
MRGNKRLLGHSGLLRGFRIALWRPSHRQVMTRIKVSRFESSITFHIVDAMLEGESILLPVGLDLRHFEERPIMYTTFVVTLGLLTAGAFAAPAPSTHVLHEKRDISSLRWIKGDRFESDIVMPVRIGMTQSNLDLGHDHLMDISDPESENYGKHWSAEDVHDLFAPSSKTVDAVRSWLEAAGIQAERISQSVNKQWMQFDATTAELEDLVKAKYHHFEHSALGRTSVACDEYHVPADVREHVDYILPGIKHTETKIGGRDLSKRNDVSRRSLRLPPLPAPLPATISTLLSLGGAICSTVITPDCISRMYNITAATKHAAGNELGIFEDLGDVYSQTDLNLFFGVLATQIPQGTHPQLKAVDGAVAPNPVYAAGAESDLDFQISYPVIYPQGSVLFQTDDPVYEANYTYLGFYNNFLDAIDGSYCSSSDETLDPPYPDPQAGGYKGQKQCGVYKPTNVISFSYGGAEFDLPASYQIRLSMQGVTLVMSSGDSGVAGSAGDDNANGCLGPNANIFSPDSAADCPYILAVGGTYLPTGANADKDQEVAVTRFPSGGGFSNIFATPSYQSSAVNTYFKTAGTQYKYYNTSGSENPFPAANNGGIYNIAGRGYPDVSAVGDNILIFNAGLPTLIGGTSASAPLWGGIITRINEERIAAGKSTVGFVNPTLYKNPSAFHDITVGNNPGCGTDGFAVSKGWDPVTGLEVGMAISRMFTVAYSRLGDSHQTKQHLKLAADSSQPDRPVNIPRNEISRRSSGRATRKTVTFTTSLLMNLETSLPIGKFVDVRPQKVTDQAPAGMRDSRMTGLHVFSSKHRASFFFSFGLLSLHCMHSIRSHDLG